MDQFNIFLIGFMGTGKTTIANCLSRKLDRKVVEMDQIISERAGMSISDIFKTYGEQHFRDLETGLLVETQSGMPVIVSCGGGTPGNVMCGKCEKMDGLYFLRQNLRQF